MSGSERSARQNQVGFGIENISMTMVSGSPRYLKINSNTDGIISAQMFFQGIHPCFYILPKGIGQIQSGGFQVNTNHGTPIIAIRYPTSKEWARRALYNMTMSEKIKNYLGLALVVASLAFAFAAVGFVVTRPNTSERVFSVSAEGEVVSIPDIGRFTFSVLTEGGKNASEVQTANTEASNKVVEYLKAQGVAKEDIKSTGYYINPRYQYYNCRPVPFIESSGISAVSEACPPPGIVGYTVEHTLSVKVRDLEKAGSLVGGVVTNGANTVSELTFEVDDPTQPRQAAIEEAVTKARTKAEATAKAGHFRLGRLVSINTSEQPYAVPYYAEYGGKGGADTASVSPAVEPGSQNITVTVYLTYEIK